MDWKETDERLIRRGELILDPSLLESHEQELKTMNKGRRGRPFFSSLVKNVLPITVITILSLLTFLIHPKNFGQRIGLAVSTLMAASAIHLSLLNALPPTGYLTLADRMVLIVYIIFLFNLAVSVYIMRLVDKNKMDEAGKFNSLAAKALVALTVAMIAAQFFF